LRQRNSDQELRTEERSPRSTFVGSSPGLKAGGRRFV
jgi:hypothetical protein